MRYDNWDVILFPKDSAVPIQEFRTACYTTPDEHGRQLPTLTCYIASLPAAAPFRMSVHSWITPAKPSSLIESRRRSSQKVVFAAQLIVDGDRVYHSFYDVASRWPQEITNEKRTATDPQQATSQRGSSLEFPPFHQTVLTQPSWNAREHNGRIKLLLSEQLIGKNSNPGETDLGVANELVCFAFQHAPQDILEQAGISWPVRNPLYLASDIRGPQVSQLLGSQTVRDLAAENRARSLSSQHSPSMFARPRNADPFVRTNTDPPLYLSQLPKPIMGGKIRRPGLWNSSLEDCSGAYDDMSLESWSSKRTNSHTNLDTSMPDMLYASPIFGQPGDTWTTLNAPHDLQMGKHDVGKHTRRETGARQVVVTLREDQLGQLIEAISPPKKTRECKASGQHLSTGGSKTHTTTTTTTTKTQPPLANIKGESSTRPSAAALARNGPYPELQQKKLNKTFVVNENLQPSYAQDGLRLLSGFSHAGRVPTPHPFVVPQAQMNRWNSDNSMRDTSMHSGLLRRPHSKERKPSSAPISAASGGIKSRKESINLLATSPPFDVRHDQGLLPEADPATKHKGASRNTSNVTSPHTHIDDIIDIDAVDDAFVPGHKRGTSSIDSTSRLERKLYSALGEELSFHADADSLPGAESEEITGGTDMVDLELDVPATKRKRQGTLGGERDRSPMVKMVREEINDDPLGDSPGISHLGGGD